MSYSTGATDGVSSYGDARVTRHFRACTAFLPCVAGWIGSFCRRVCGGLERQSETRFALPARHHKSMSCPTLAPTELVDVCIVQALFPSKILVIAPPPRPFLEGPGCAWDCVLYLHVAGHPVESITLLRLIVVPSSRLLLVSKGGLALCLYYQCLAPFPWNAYNRMSSSQLATSSSV